MIQPFAVENKLPVLKTLACPKCGSPLSQYSPGAQTIICPKCYSYVVITADGIGTAGSGSRLPAAPVPVVPGQKATFDGAGYFVLGRILYEGWDPEDTTDRWRWNEWLLGGADGQLRWLNYDDEDGFVLFDKLRLREPFDASKASAIPLGSGRKALVRERYPAQIIGAEGELSFKAQAGDRLNVVDAAGAGKKYSVEYDAEELELYEGAPLTTEAVAQAFAHPEWIKAMQGHGERRRLLLVIGGLCLLFALAGFFLALQASGSGELATSQTVNLDSPTATARFPVVFENPGRPALIRARLISVLPANSGAALDVTVVGPDSTENLVIEHDFYYETGVESGYDEGEYYSETYSESDLAGEEVYTPQQAGEHEVEVGWSDAQGVSGLTIQVDVYKNHTPPTWFIAYGAIAGIAGLAFLVIGSRKTRAGAASKPSKGGDDDED